STAHASRVSPRTWSFISILRSGGNSSVLPNAHLSLASLIVLVVWPRCRERAYRPRSELRLLALRARRAYDKNLPFLGAFQSSKGDVKVGPLEGGRGEGLHEIGGGGGRAMGRRRQRQGGRLPCRIV